MTYSFNPVDQMREISQILRQKLQFYSVYLIIGPSAASIFGMHDVRKNIVRHSRLQTSFDNFVIYICLCMHLQIHITWL